MWWDLSSSLVIVRVPDVRRRPTLLGDGSVALVFADGRRAVVEIPGNKLWSSSPPVLFTRHTAYAYRRAASDAAAITAGSSSHRALPDGAAAAGSVQGVAVWPWSASAMSTVLLSACALAGMNVARKSVARAVAPSAEILWDALFPAECYVITDTTVVAHAPCQSAALNWVIRHAQQHNIVLDRVCAFGSATIPASAAPHVLKALTTLKISSVCRELVERRAELFPPESPWLPRLAKQAKAVASMADVGSATDPHTVALLKWVHAQAIMVSADGLSDRGYTDRKNEFVKQLRLQARRSSRSYPKGQKWKCYSVERDDGTGCMRCPIPATHNQRFMLCGAGPDDTPATVYTARHAAQLPPPPCVQAFTGDSNASRFDMAMVCAQVYYSPAPQPPGKRSKPLPR